MKIDNKETKKERERCKEIIERKINWAIEEKLKLKKRRSRAVSHLERLKEVILFLVDNPDYKRKNDND